MSSLAGSKLLMESGHLQKKENMEMIFKYVHNMNNIPHESISKEIRGFSIEWSISQLQVSKSCHA